MGFDTSFHPVDFGVCQRLHPYILGDAGAESIDDLVRDAVRIAKVRFRANAWGLGATKSKPPASFQAHLHVWGRPFLVTGEGTEAIAAGIDAYLAAQPSQVDEIARAMLDRLEPGFAARVRPDEGGTLPDDAALARSIRARVDVMRDCVTAIRAGRPTVALGDRELDAAGTLARELMDVVVELAAAVRPGWMSRGHTWPTALLGSDPARKLFIANVAPVMPIYKAFGQLRWAVADTIHENYMVGGCLSPRDIPTVRAALSALPVAPGHELERRKLDEALADAAHRNLPFAEATEIYSGMSGIMN
jgi:hypothetical protein